jgi:hypothetical protein
MCIIYNLLLSSEFYILSNVIFSIKFISFKKNLSSFQQFQSGQKKSTSIKFDKKEHCKVIELINKRR